MVKASSGEPGNHEVNKNREPLQHLISVGHDGLWHLRVSERNLAGNCKSGDLREEKKCEESVMWCRSQVDPQ